MEHSVHKQTDKSETFEGTTGSLYTLGGSVPGIKDRGTCHGPYFVPEVFTKKLLTDLPDHLQRPCDLLLGPSYYNIKRSDDY